MPRYSKHAQRQRTPHRSTRRRSQFSFTITGTAIALLCLIASANDGFTARAASVAPALAVLSDVPSHNRVPSLRNVAERAPYMHAGQIRTLAAVVRHYNEAPRAPFGHSELKPLRLSREELRQLEAFLRTLSGPLSAPEGYLTRPQVQR